jgi:hypothetical protein
MLIKIQKLRVESVAQIANPEKSLRVSLIENFKLWIALKSICLLQPPTPDRVLNNVNYTRAPLRTWV